MSEGRFSLRMVIAFCVSAAALAVLLTLLALRLLGALLQPGLNTPAVHKLLTSYQHLQQVYYWPMPSNQLVDAAIVGMTNSLHDPFTDYFPPAQARLFQTTLAGSFSGIGVLLEKTGEHYVIVSVEPDSPARKAGLKAGDEIVRVNGQPVDNLQMPALRQMITGPTGTTVLLSVVRPASTSRVVQFTVRREAIHVPSAYSSILSGRIGYVRLLIVDENSASEVHTALAKLKRTHVRGFVVDLRGNGGGYLDQAVKIAGEFIPAGATVVKTQMRDENPEVVPSPGPGMKLPVVVLIDGDTASAAEILAAALHQDIAAPLVGTRSYGKGTVQETDAFSDGSMLKYTVARWLTPNGSWIHHKGLNPTVVAPSSPGARIDVPLLKAEQLLKKSFLRHAKPTAHVTVG